MPINFEPMQPVDTRAMEAYGAALARQQTAELSLRAQAQAQAAADRSSELAQNDDHFRAQLQQQAGLENMREANQANLAFAGMAHQEAMQNARINAEFTQADNLRLQKLNQDAAGWDALRRSGEIDDGEYQQGLRMINQGRGPLQAKREAQQQRQEAAQTRRLMQQNAEMATIQAQNSSFQARALPDGTVNLPDPNNPGQILRIGTPDGRGGYDWHEAQPRGGAGGVNGPGGIADQLHNSLIHDIEVQMYNEETPRDPLQAKPAWAATPESRQDEFDRRYGQRMDLLTGQRPPNPASAPLMQEIASRFSVAERAAQAVDNATRIAGGQPTQVNRISTIRRGLENIVQRYPDPARMPAPERRRLERFYAQLNELLPAQATQQVQPSNAVRVPPVVVRTPAPYQGPTDTTDPASESYASPYGQ